MFQNNLLNNNNTGLPFSAESLNRNPVQINVEHPPFVPNVPCTNEFQQVLPIVTGSTINAISSGATNSNLRAFAFNQLSENNFENQSFVDLVSLIVSLMMYNVYVQKQNTDLSSLIHNSVQRGIEYLLALNATQYPGLQGFLDGQAQNNVRNLLSELQQLQPQLQQMMYQISRGGNIGINTNNRPSFSSGVAIGGGGNTPNAIFSNTFQPPVQPNVATSDTAFGNRYGNIKPMDNTNVVTSNQIESNSTVEIPVAIPEEVDTESTVPVRVATSKLKWLRTDSQPYAPIVKRGDRELFVQLGDDGKPTLSIGKRSEESMFDYETHTTLSNFGVRPSTRLLPTDDQIEAINSKLIKAIDNGTEVISRETEQIPKLKLLKHTYSSVEYSLESVCLEHEISKAGYIVSGKTDNIDLFKTDCYIIESLGTFTEKDYRELERLRLSESFEELVVKLKSSAPNMNKRAWRAIERKLTRVVNDVLKYQLSLDLHIDSFLMDIESLMDVIKRKSTSVYDAMVRNELNIIRFCIAPVKNSDIESTVRDTVLTNEFGDKEYKIDLEFLHNEISVTSMNIDSEQLDVELYGVLGNVILHTESKLLHAMVHSVLQSKTKSSPIGFDYILLNDGVVLRINKGLIGAEFYTVNVVN